MSCKLLLNYNPHKNIIGNHVNGISESLDLLSSDYKKMIFLVDFNVNDNEQHMQSFFENYGLKNLIRKPTYYKNLQKFSKVLACMDLILTNVPRSFQNSSTPVVQSTCRDRAVCIPFDFDCHEKDF